MSQRIIFQYLRQMLEIAAKEIVFKEKCWLLWTYTMFMAQYVWKAKLFPRSEKTIRFAGLRMSFPDWITLRVTFKEMFIDKLYDIDLGTDTPFIIDGGSNMGMSIAAFKRRYPKARIIGFEPSLETYFSLRENVNRNFPDVTACLQALAGGGGKVHLWGPSDNSTTKTMIAAMISSGRVSHETVMCVALSTVIGGEQRTVDLLKLDIEGAENEVLDDLISSDVLRCVKRIIVEYHSLIGKPNGNFASFILKLESCGYAVRIEASRHVDPESKVYAVIIYAERV